MWLSVKVVALLFASCALQNACGLPSSRVIESDYPEASPAEYEDSLRDAGAPDSQMPVFFDEGGSSAVEIPADLPLPDTDVLNFVKVNAREDIPGMGEESRMFQPLDVASASREAHRKIHEAIRQFSERFDLRFLEAPISVYPLDAYQHPRPPYPSLFGPFHLPPPPPPPPFTRPFHSSPPFFQDMPFPKPSHPQPPRDIPSQPYPSLNPFPPPSLRPPPPLPPIHYSPPSTVGSPPTPSNPPQEPTTTPSPSSNVTDIWDILLPWWYPLHNQPPTTKPPRPVTSGSTTKEPMPASVVDTTTESLTNAAETSTAESFISEEPTTKGVMQVTSGIEFSSAANEFVITEKEEQATEITLLIDDTSEPEAESATVGNGADKVEPPLILLIGNAEKEPNSETATEVNSVTTVVPTTPEKDGESNGSTSERASEGVSESSTTEGPKDSEKGEQSSSTSTPDAKETEKVTEISGTATLSTEGKDEPIFSTTPPPDGGLPDRSEEHLYGDDNKREEHSSTSNVLAEKELATTMETMTSDSTDDVMRPVEPVIGKHGAIEENEISN